MRRFFEPSEAPLWLNWVLASIRDGLSDVWATALRLKDYATTNLPPAADWKQGLVYDSTLDAPHYSNGTSWVRLSDYDADVAALAALSTTGLIARTGSGTVTTRTIAGPAAGIAVSNGDGVSGNPTLALANDLAALEALSGTGTIYYRSAADTWTAVSIGGNLGFSAGTLGSSLGTAATRNTGTSGTAVPLLDGANTHSGLVTTSAGIRDTGPVIARFENDGTSPPSGSAGVGIEIFNVAGDSHIRSYNRTTSAINPLILDGSTLSLNVSNNPICSVISTGLNLASGKSLAANGGQVVAERKTGWSVDTGTSKRTANATYTGTASVGYVQAELQGVMDALRDATQTIKALKDDLHANSGHGLIGT